MQAELNQQTAALTTQFGVPKKDLQFSGPYDDHDAVLTLSAGAGGTDAKTGPRCYLECLISAGQTHRAVKLRWWMNRPGKRAGLKSPLEISGPFVYGKLRANTACTAKCG